MSKKFYPKHVVGLARVSHEKQAGDQPSLKVQCDAIKREAESFGVTPIVHEEIGSGGRPWRERTILREMLRDAAHKGATVMVAAVDRLARELGVLDELVRLRLPVWVVGRGKITREQLSIELNSAKDERDRIRRVAIRDHDTRKLAGKRRGGTITYETSVRGSDEGHLRAGDRDRRIFKLLDTHPEWSSLSHRALADHLNALGILNVVTIAGRGRPWSLDSVKKLRIRYRQYLDLEAEMDIADGITPLDLHGAYSRVEAARARQDNDTSKRESQEDPPENEGVK